MYWWYPAKKHQSKEESTPRLRKNPNFLYNPALKQHKKKDKKKR
jgi:hypothetical protein